MIHLFDPIYMIVTTAACLGILWRAEAVLAAATREMPFITRLAFWTLCVGAAAEVACMAFYGRIPSIQEALLSAGIAELLVPGRNIGRLVSLRRIRPPLGGKGRP